MNILSRFTVVLAVAALLGVAPLISEGSKKKDKASEQGEVEQQQEQTNADDTKKDRNAGGQETGGKQTGDDGESKSVKQSGSDQTGGQEQGANETELVAKVNGTEISRTAYERVVKNEYGKRMQQGQFLDQNAVEQLKSDVLESMINQELIFQEGTRQGYTADQELIDQEYELVRANFADQEQFEQALSQAGYTKQSLKDEIRRNIIISKYIEETVAPSVSVSEQEMQEYYDEHPEVFTQPEQVKASHIIMTVEDPEDEAAKKQALSRITEVQKRVEAGEDFAELARETSEGPSAARGGDLGFFQRGQMVKEFEEKAFSLEPGEVSDIVETQYGYHIIKVMDRRPEMKVPFQDVRDQIANYMRQNRSMDILDSRVEKLREKASIERYTAAPQDSEKG
jgi:peptidyl-prolyl cis-trans isomerase C